MKQAVLLSVVFLCAALDLKHPLIGKPTEAEWKKAASLGDDDDVILPGLNPSDKTLTDIGVVWIQGAMIPASQYSEIARDVQVESLKSQRNRVWVGIPEFLLSTPEPLRIEEAVERALGKMYAAGLPANAPLFMFAHSLGGIIAQDFLINNGTFFKGAALMGSFLTRDKNATFHLPTLTIGGEVDGLCRIIRIAEAYLYQTVQGTNGSPNKERYFPVVALPGASHMQFASGEPPFAVRQSDLKPFSSEDDVHSWIAQIISAYVQSVVTDTDSPVIQKWLQDSTQIFQPILDALELEGYYHSKPPCNCQNPTDIPPDRSYFPIGGVNYYPCFQNHTTCRNGSPWGEFAQTVMGGLTNVTYNVTSAFQVLSEEHPTNLPYVFQTCTPGQPDCKLDITVVTENSYGFDALDSGFFKQTAENVAQKMMSRQSIYIAGGNPQASYDELDSKKDLCAEINQKAFDWAFAHVRPQMKAWYQQYGQNITYASDREQSWGPGFILSTIDYTTTDNGALSISSPSLPTPHEYFISYSCCFHYCKLVSPARAVEIIMNDGFRYQRSL